MIYTIIQPMYLTSYLGLEPLKITFRVSLIFSNSLDLNSELPNLAIQCVELE